MTDASTLGGSWGELKGVLAVLGTAAETLGVPVDSCSESMVFLTAARTLRGPGYSSRDFFYIGNSSKDSWGTWGQLKRNPWVLGTSAGNL